MAGLPFLSQKLAEKQLETVKPEIISAAGRQISQLVDNLEDQINLYVKKNMEQIELQSLEEFSRLLRSYEVILKGEINGKQNEAVFIQEHQVKLSILNEMIEKEILEGVQA
jgi:hypothetical protein